MEAETRLSLLNKWLYNAGFVDPANGRVRNPFGFLRAEEITDSQLFDNLLVVSEDLVRKLVEPAHQIFLGQPGSGRTTLARYAHVRLDPQSLGIYSDLDSAAEAAHEPLQSGKTGDFYLVLDQQQPCLLDEIGYFLDKLQGASVPGRRTWAKLFLPLTERTDVEALRSFTGVRIEELIWSREEVHEMLDARLDWASGHQDVKTSLHNFAHGLLINQTITELGAPKLNHSVDDFLVDSTQTPRQLLESAHRLVALSRLEDPNGTALTRKAWLTLTRPVLTLKLGMQADGKHIDLVYEKPGFRQEETGIVFPYPKTKRSGNALDEPSTLLRALFRPELDNKFDDSEKEYLRKNDLAESSDPFQVRTDAKKIVGRKLWELLSRSRSFVKDLESAGFNADIRLTFRDTDGFLASFPWELIYHRRLHLLIEAETGLIRHLDVRSQPPRARPRLNVLYVAPRPRIPKGWPAYTSGRRPRPITNEDLESRIFHNKVTNDVCTLEGLTNEMRGSRQISAVHLDMHVVQAHECQRCHRWVSVRKEICSKPRCNCHEFGPPTSICYFERSETRRTIDAVDIRELRRLNWAGITLCVLYACNSASPAEADSVTTGVAQALLEAGVRCVVAMQAPIYGEGDVPTKFFKTLYRELQNTGCIATAMRRVRVPLRNSLVWWIPTVYMCENDTETTLFEVQAD